MSFEHFVNTAQTTLSASITSTATTITVASSAGFPTLTKLPADPGASQFRILVENEMMLVTTFPLLPATTTWTVQRGIEGTVAAAHASAKSVTAILTAGALNNAARTYNVKIFGAKGDNATDDTSAIQAAIDAANTAGGGTVLLPNGTYIVSNILTLGASCLTLKTGVVLLGESKTGAIIKLRSMSNGVPQIRPILAFNCTDIAVCNLSIDGNKANQTVDEHRAGIFLWNVSRVLLQDLIIHDNTGDAVDIYVANDVYMQRSWCHHNDRKAVTINGGPNNRMSIRDCMFEFNVGQLHIESGAACSELWFEDTFCGEPTGGGLPVSIGGLGVGCYLRGLEIHGGLSITGASRVRVRDCYIEAGLAQGATGPCPLAISFDVDDCIVEGCTIYQSAAQGSSDHAVFIQAAAAAGPQRPRRIVLRDNYISTVYVLAQAVTILNAQDVIITGNTLINPVDANDARPAIGISATEPLYASPQVGTVLIAENHIYNWYEAVAVGAAANGLKVGSVTIVNNVVEKGGVTTCRGWNLESGLFGAPPVTNVLLQCAMSGNDLVNVTPTWVTYPPCPILTGGERGGGGMYLCAGDPNTKITESVGASAHRRDGGAGTTLYVKESGTGNTGWAGK